MKKQLMAITTVLAVFTVVNSSAEPQHLRSLKDVTSAFKNHSTVVPKIDSRDIMMGYAGQDVVNRKTII